MHKQMSLDEERLVGEGGLDLDEKGKKDKDEDGTEGWKWEGADPDAQTGDPEVDAEKERSGDVTSANPSELKQGAPGGTVPGGSATEGAPAGNP